MFGGMKNKLQEMQKQMEEVRERLGKITVRGEAADGKIKVTADGNRRITQIELLPMDHPVPGSAEFSEALTTAVNRALEQAERVSESEMQGVAMGMMPNFPGLFK